MKIKGFILILLISLSCSKQEGRRPMHPKPSTTLLYETVAASKSLNAQEVSLIEAFIAKDTVHTYIDSKNGFWYAYKNKSPENSLSPQIGDEVVFEYDITDLQGNEIYSKEVLGIKNYKVDKEDLISALQKGIKLMKVGETMLFVIPSYHAFGVAGDGNKIEINQTIKSTVTILNIK